jgi:hypothetical protein
LGSCKNCTPDVLRALIMLRIGFTDEQTVEQIREIP